MLATGRAIYVGNRSGEANGKRWMNVFLDDPDNPLQRLQVFVPSSLIDTIASFKPLSSVIVQLRVFTRQGDRYPDPALSLTAIQLDKER